MSAEVRKVHVTHEKYATRTIEEELAILNGRDWKEPIGAKDCAINHGWSICEENYYDHLISTAVDFFKCMPGPIAVFNKDDKFVALNRIIRGENDWRLVFEKELPVPSTKS